MKTRSLLAFIILSSLMIGMKGTAAAHGNQPTVVLQTYLADLPVVGQGGNCITGNIIDVHENLVTDGVWTIKVANNNSPTTFVFNGNVQPSSFSIPGPFPAGTYVVTLVPPAGWQAYTPIVFTVSLSGDAAAGCAGIRFKMVAQANLKVTKLDIHGMVGIPGWNITVDNRAGIVKNATTDGWGNAYFSNLPPGNWWVTEENRSGWKMVAGTPYFANPQQVYLASPQIPGTFENMTFVNQQVSVGSITVIKKDTDGKPLDHWQITLRRTNGTQPDRKGATGDDGIGTGAVTFRNLQLGQWDIIETPKDPFWRANPDNPQTVNLDQTDPPLTVILVNEELGCVDGYKINQLEAGLPGWKISTHKVSGNDADQVYTTDATGYFKFYLSMGTWEISEELQSGWTAVTPAEFDIEVTQKSVCQHVRFKNSIDYACIDAYKKDFSGGVGLPGWQISLRPEFDASAAVKVGTTDGSGWVRFDQLAPGFYRIWETPQLGWTQQLVRTGYQTVPPRVLPMVLLNNDALKSTTINLQANGSCMAVEFYNFQNNMLSTTSAAPATSAASTVPAVSAAPATVSVGFPWKTCRIYYSILPGDSISVIAQRFGVSVLDLQNANPIVSSSLLSQNMELCIP
jgi:hypothetical protein